MHRAHHQCHYGIMQIANMLVAAKADDVCMLDVSSQCSFTEHMVLATGRSHRHIQAAAAAVAYQVSLANCLTPLGAATSVHVRPSIVHYQLIKCGCKCLGDHLLFRLSFCHKTLFVQMSLRCSEVAPGIQPSVEGEDGSDWCVVDAGMCYLVPLMVCCVVSLTLC